MAEKPKIIEHEKMVVTTYGTFPESQANRIISEIKAKEKANVWQPVKLKSCPFRTGMNSECRGNLCALFDETACSIVTGSKVNTGNKCPFGDGGTRCGADCALNHNGHCAMCRKENNE